MNQLIDVLSVLFMVMVNENNEEDARPSKKNVKYKKEVMKVT